MRSSIRQLMSIATLLVAVSFASASPSATRPPQGVRSYDFSDLGTTWLYPGDRSRLVLLFADRVTDGSGASLAAALAASGRSVAFVGVDDLLAHVVADHRDCLDAVTLLDVYAQQVQRELHFDRPDAPVLVGLGSGVSFVRLLLAASRGGLFVAGIGAGRSAPLALPVPPCGRLAGEIGWRSARTPLALPARLALAAPWSVTADAAPGTVSRVIDDMERRTAETATVSGLPLIELPSSGGGTVPWFAVVISGDGGWANIDRDIAEDLGARGIPVLGWNTLRYFWNAKTPDQAGGDLVRVVRHYLRAWGQQRVLLIGYSLGADVLPFMVDRVPPDVRAAIVGVVLLAPGPTANFEFHVSDWFGSDRDASPLPLAPELQRIGDIPVLCIHAAGEADESLCPALIGRQGVHVVELPGDHHFDGDYNAIVTEILERFPIAH